PAGHGIDQIVHADDLQIDVPARGVNQMIAADGRKIAIPGIYDHVQLWVCQLQARREGNGAAVRGMERIEFDVTRHASRAADARDQGQRSQVDFRFDEGARKRVHGGADAASRTPDVRDAIAAQELLDWIRAWIDFVVE